MKPIRCFLHKFSSGRVPTTKYAHPFLSIPSTTIHNNALYTSRNSTTQKIIFNFHRKYSSSSFFTKNEDSGAEIPVPDLEKNARAAGAEEMVNLAIQYWNGAEGIERDADRAIKLLEDAALMGSVQAKFNLGVAMFYDNPHRATELWTEAADSGMADAQFNLGTSYLNGFGVEKNEATAIALIEQAAEQNHADALCIVAATYGTGQLGKPKDLTKAFTCYEKAAKQNHPEGLLNLSHFYETGEGGVTKNESYAFFLLQAAAAEGHLAAQYNLGRCYSEGVGVEKDMAKAIEQWTGAAKAGFAAAQYYLGVSYHLGNGVPKNHEETFKWWEAAAIQGYPEAHHALKVVFDVDMTQQEQ